jgi:hypothetical protein
MLPVVFDTALGDRCLSLPMSGIATELTNFRQKVQENGL